MPEFRITKGAEADLVHMFKFGLEAFGLAQAERYRQSMVHCFQLLADNPRLGRPADQVSPGTRRHEHGKHVIFYRQQTYGVRISGVVHNRSFRLVLLN